MSHVALNRKILIVTLMVALTSCTQKDKPLAQKTAPAAPKTFESPSSAGAALLTAVQSGDRTALVEIFGPDGADVLFSGDTERDKAALQDFVTAYTQMNRWGEIRAGGQTLYIGADNYAFPIPLGQDSTGRWSFDTAAGKDEITARRIGKGELAAIAACEAIADAQNQYFSKAHDGGKVRQYARTFLSDPGKQNGLYWPVAEGGPASPLGRLGDFAKVVPSTAGGQPLLFNGYYYRILSPPDDLAGENLTGGFAVLAYPAEYRNSGLMTFIVGKDGTVYQKDLGEKTGEVALAMTSFNPAEGWSPSMPHTSEAERAQ